MWEGSSTVKVAPWPGLLARWMEPPWAASKR
jgi:hypothetical protein